MSGFTPSRKLTGGDFNTMRFEVDLSADQNLFIGDACTVTTNGTIRQFNGTNDSLCGIVVGLYNSDGRQLTFSQPGSGPYLAGVDGYADVVVDPSVVFTVDCDATAAQTAIFANADVTAAAGNAASGLSGYKIKYSTVGTSANLPFKILGPAKNDTNILSNPDGDGTGLKLQVVINNSFLKSGTTGV